MPEFGQPTAKVNTFTARFDSECVTCFGDILEGELAGYLPGDDKPSCRDCVEEFEDE